MIRYLLIAALAWSSTVLADNEYTCVFDSKQYILKVSKTSLMFCPEGDSFGCDWHKDLVDIEKLPEDQIIMTSKDGIETRFSHLGGSGMFNLAWRANDSKNRFHDQYLCAVKEE